jgi:hypothetical protein
MSEIPTKPGGPYRVTHEDARRAYAILATGANGFIEALQDFADRRFSASPWRPASEPPVVPEGKESIDIILSHQWRPGRRLYVNKVIQRFDVWSHIAQDPTDEWMPIPPRGEGGAE